MTSCMIAERKLRKQTSERALRVKFGSLSKDPRSWSREEVGTWLDFTVVSNGLPVVSPDRSYLSYFKTMSLTSRMLMEATNSGCSPERDKQ